MALLNRDAEQHRESVQREREREKERERERERERALSCLLCTHFFGGKKGGVFLKGEVSVLFKIIKRFVL